jgi:hypothetical protein
MLNKNQTFSILYSFRYLPKPSPNPRAILEQISKKGKGAKKGVANVTNDHVNTAKARTVFVPKRRTNI